MTFLNGRKSDISKWWTHTDSDAPVLGKWLQLLKDIAPSVTRVAVIFNPDTTAGPYIPLFSRAIEAVAPSLGVTVTLVPMRDDAAIENAVAAQAI